MKLLRSILRRLILLCGVVIGCYACGLFVARHWMKGEKPKPLNATTVAAPKRKAPEKQVVSTLPAEPVSQMDSLMEGSENWNIGQIQQFFHRLTLQSFSDVPAALDKLGVRYRSEALLAVAETLLTIDPEQALRLSDKGTLLEKPSEEPIAFRLWATRDLPAARRWAEAHPENEFVKNHLMDAWLASNPKQALDWFQEHPTELTINSPIPYILSEAASKDPTQMLALLPELPTGELRLKAVEGIARGLGKLDLNLAAEFVKQEPAAKESVAGICYESVFGLERNLTESGLRMRKKQPLPIDVLEETFGMDREDPRVQTLEAKQRITASNDLDFLIQQRNQTNDGYLIHSATDRIDELVEIQARKPLKESLAWAEGLPNAATREVAMTSVIQQSACIDPVGTAKQVLQMSDSTQRAKFLKEVANSIRPEDKTQLTAALVTATWQERQALIQAGWKNLTDPAKKP